MKTPQERIADWSDTEGVVNRPSAAEFPATQIVRFATGGCHNAIGRDAEFGAGGMMVGKNGEKLCGAIRLAGNTIGCCGKPGTHWHPHGNQHAQTPGWLCEEHWEFVQAHPDNF
jgi:hypothetical protein